MKKVLLVLLLLCSGLLFAAESKMKVGDSPYYFATKNFAFSYLLKKDYQNKKYRVLEVAPVNDVCKVSMSDGTVFYVRKGEKIRYETINWFDEEEHYEGTVKDFDYNYLLLDIQKITEYSSW